MKKMFLLLTAALGLAACSDPYLESREAAETAGQSLYAIRYNDTYGQQIRLVFIDPTTGCEYWDDDQLPKNGPDGKQVCLPTTLSTPRATTKQPSLSDD